MLDRSRKVSEIHPYDEWSGCFLQDGKVYGASGQFLPNHPDNKGKKAPRINAKGKVTGKVTVEKPSLNAAELLMSMEDMKFFEFKKNAKRILGEHCPSKKVDMVKKLELRASEPKPVKSKQGLTWDQSKEEVNLAAWGEGQADYIFPDVMMAIQSRYSKSVTNKFDAITFLIEEGVVNGANARDK